MLTPRQLRSFLAAPPEMTAADQIDELEAERQLLSQYSGIGGLTKLRERLEAIKARLIVLRGLPLE